MKLAYKHPYEQDTQIYANRICRSAVKIHTIRGEDSMVSLPANQTFGPFRFEMNLDDTLSLSSLALFLQKQAFDLGIKKSGNQYQVALNATYWLAVIGSAP